MVVITAICSSCNLEAAYPVPPPPKPSDSSGNYVIPPNGNGSDTSRAHYAYVRVFVSVDSGSAHFSGRTLAALSLQSRSSTASFVLGSANAQTGQTNATVSLVHAENAWLIAGSAGTWKATFPSSATDTLNQPYIKAVVVDDAQKKIFDYRAYFTNNATLDYMYPGLTGSLEVASFIYSFNAKNVPVITVQP